MNVRADSRSEAQQFDLSVFDWEVTLWKCIWTNGYTGLKTIKLLLFLWNVIIFSNGRTTLMRTAGEIMGIIQWNNTTSTTDRQSLIQQHLPKEWFCLYHSAFDTTSYRCNQANPSAQIWSNSGIRFFSFDFKDLFQTKPDNIKHTDTKNPQYTNNKQENNYKQQIQY